MVKRKSTVKKARTRTVYRTAPRRRSTHKAGYDRIASAMATVALVGANIDNIKSAVGFVQGYGLTESFKKVLNQTGHAVQVEKKFINADQLVKDGVALAGGYLAGEIVRKYAPTVIKKPIAKVAKKIPKVI